METKSTFGNESNSLSSSFFSVILITYNRVKLIPKAIESLLSQSEKDFEAIIIDDGSIDSTFQTLKPIVDKNSRFHYIYHSHKGVAFSRNLGIKFSSGKYITFLDSDDEYLPNHLETRKSILMANPDVDILHGGAKIIGNPYVPDRFNPEKLTHLDDCIVGGTLFIKRTSAIALGGFPNLPYADDSAFVDLAIERGMKILKTDIKSYVYNRLSEDSVCDNISNTKSLSNINLYRNV